MSVLQTIIIFALLVLYLRFWTNQSLLALHDENYLYGICSMVMSIGILMLVAAMTGIPQIMPMAALIILTPVIASIVYGDRF